MKGVAGRVAIVTGGASGIGRALCEELARRQALVIVADLNGDEASRLAKLLTDAGGRASAVPVDVARADSVRELACGRGVLALPSRGSPHVRSERERRVPELRTVEHRRKLLPDPPRPDGFDGSSPARLYARGHELGESDRQGHFAEQGGDDKARLHQDVLVALSGIALAVLPSPLPHLHA